MGLKAVLLDFNGTLINDEPIHKHLIEQLLQEHHCGVDGTTYNELCLGRSDRACFQDCFAHHGRSLEEPELSQLLSRKVQAYHAALEQLSTPPLYPDVADFVFKVRLHQLKLAIVTGAHRAEVEVVLQRTTLGPYFSAIITSDEISHSKPHPEGYLRAIAQLNREFPMLNLQARDCLVVEDTYAGIEAAKRAGMRVAAVANTYPFHMLQRQSDWTVDRLMDLELERIAEVFETDLDRQSE